VSARLIGRAVGRLRLLAAGGALVLLAGACGGSPEPGGSAGSQQNAPTVPITFSLDFAFDGLHSPFIVADEKGWYRDAGLDVRIQPSSGSQDSLTRLATGAAQLGVVSSSTVLAGIANQRHPVKVVGMLLQHDASATETQKSLNITTPAGLAGRTVATPPASTQNQFFPALLKANNIDPASIKNVAITPPAAKQTLLTGQVDATNIFGPVFADVADKVNILYWYKFGLDIYGSTITANTGFLAQNPDAVRKFLDASMRGLQYVVDHPDEAGSLVAKRAQSSAAFFQAEVKEFLQFYDLPAAPKGPGTMDSAKWAQTQQINTQYGAQQREVPPDTVFTNDFLPGTS
jgi:NitT/TauT family transport system substrate-binding protein